MRYSELKELKNKCSSLDSEPSWREVAAHAGSDDFEVDGVRFIKESEINRILAEELSADLYMLGCFNAWFIAEQADTGLDTDDIKEIQNSGGYEAIGKIIIKHTDMEEFAEAYASADGYGHHFNRYDGNEEEWKIGGENYYVFDNRY